MKALQETGVCAMCKGMYTHFGNNPEPLLKFQERVCDKCNSERVIPARIAQMHPKPLWGK